MTEPFVCESCGAPLEYIEFREFTHHHAVSPDGRVEHRRDPVLIEDTYVEEGYVACTQCGRQYTHRYEYRDDPPRILRVDPATGRGVE